MKTHFCVFISYRKRKRPWLPKWADRGPILSPTTVATGLTVPSTTTWVATRSPRRWRGWWGTFKKGSSLFPKCPYSLLCGAYSQVWPSCQYLSLAVIWRCSQHIVNTHDPLFCSPDKHRRWPFMAHSASHTSPQLWEAHRSTLRETTAKQHVGGHSEASTITNCRSTAGGGAGGGTSSSTLTSPGLNLIIQ